MATNTKNLGLKKPAPEDFYNIEDFNENFQKIDDFAKDHNHNNNSGGFNGGKNTSASSGGAIGWGATAYSGGAVGAEAKAGDGFVGGFNAKAVDKNGDGIDAIQLGSGENTNPRTLQIYDYQLMKANGNIPKERLTEATVSGSYTGKRKDTSTEAETATTITVGGVGNIICISHDDYICFLSKSGGFIVATMGNTKADDSYITQSIYTVGKNIAYFKDGILYIGKQAPTHINKYGERYNYQVL